MNSFQILIATIGIIVGLVIGNWAGDTQTFKDCATRGETEMLGGGKITCQVKPTNLK